MTQIADLSDRATESETIERENLIRNARLNLLKHKVEPTGRCLYCGDPVELPGLYCNRWCAEDHEKLKAAKRRNGN